MGAPRRGAPQALALANPPAVLPVVVHAVCPPAAHSPLDDESNGLSMCTANGTAPDENCTCTSGALNGGGGSLTSTHRKQRTTKWSHALSLAGRSVYTRAWKATYECCPFLVRSDTVSTRRRARRQRADNSMALVGTGGNDIMPTKAG